MLEDGGVKCWGLGMSGQLGYGNTDSVGDDETLEGLDTVDVGGSVVQISTGDNHTCVLLDDASVRCWGGAGLSEVIGDDETPASADAVAIGGAVTSLSSGFWHACVVMATGALRCWGSANFCQLGYGYIDAVEHDCEDIGDDETPAEAGDVPLF